jgi:hypothetical protein
MRTLQLTRAAVTVGLAVAALLPHDYFTEIGWRRRLETSTTRSSLRGILRGKLLVTFQCHTSSAWHLFQLWANRPRKDERVPLDRMVTGRLPSVDVENFSSDECRRVQVHYGVHDVRHFSHSAHRM